MARPNILWVLTTQWRGQATGYAGDANARTPWLDGPSERGRHFPAGRAGRTAEVS